MTIWKRIAKIDENQACPTLLVSRRGLGSSLFWVATTFSISPGPTTWLEVLHPNSLKLKHTKWSRSGAFRSMHPTIFGCPSSFRQGMKGLSQKKFCVSVQIILSKLSQLSRARNAKVWPPKLFLFLQPLILYFLSFVPSFCLNPIQPLLDFWGTESAIPLSRLIDLLFNTIMKILTSKAHFLWTLSSKVQYCILGPSILIYFSQNQAQRKLYYTIFFSN